MVIDWREGPVGFFFENKEEAKNFKRHIEDGLFILDGSNEVTLFEFSNGPCLVSVRHGNDNGDAGRTDAERTVVATAKHHNVLPVLSLTTSST